MRASSGNEYGLSWFLVNPVTGDVVVLVQLLPEGRIQVELLRVNGVVLVLTLELLTQELAQPRRVFRPKDIPRSTTGTTVRRGRSVCHDVDRVSHVHM